MNSEHENEDTIFHFFVHFKFTSCRGIRGQPLKKHGDRTVAKIWHDSKFVLRMGCYYTINHENVTAYPEKKCYVSL